MYKSAKELRGIGWKRIREHNNYWGVCLLSYLFLLVMELLYIGILILIFSRLYKQWDPYQYPFEYNTSDSKILLGYSMLCSLLAFATLFVTAPLQLSLVKISLSAARGQKVAVKDLLFASYRTTGILRARYRWRFFRCDFCGLQGPLRFSYLFLCAAVFAVWVPDRDFRPRFDYIGDRKFCLARAGKAVSLCGLRSEATALLIPFCDSFRAQKQDRMN